ncbi:MAG TPA: hypothetical protein VE224_14940 [Pseudolabrys sp.]|nr:hypothetical protein [Pseudolabrys sp.]
MTIAHSEPAAFADPDRTADESIPQGNTESPALPAAGGSWRLIQERIGPLGLGASAFATALAAAGAIWAIRLGVAYPIAIMAAYCTAVATIGLALVISLLPRAEEARPEQPAPDTPAVSAAWKHVNTFSVSDAARLWCDVEPGATVTQDVIAWARLLLDAIADGELACVRGEAPSGRPMSYASDKPHWSTEVTREALQNWARTRGFKPGFLQDP